MAASADAQNSKGARMCGVCKEAFLQSGATELCQWQGKLRKIYGSENEVVASR